MTKRNKHDNIYTDRDREVQKMKQYEMCVTVSYISGEETYENSFKEYVEAKDEKEAIKKLYEILEDEDYKTIDVYEIHEC